MNSRVSTFSCLIIAGITCAFHAQSAIMPPVIVGTPPSDAGRGLVRVSDTEIRVYSGTRGKPDYLVSKDNGMTWNKAMAPASYPPNFGGIPKESPAISKNPLTGEFIRVQPISGFVFLSKGGLDGQWSAVTKDGKLESDWNNEGKRKNLLTLGGIMRSPTFVNKGKRVLVPTHEMGRGTWFHISDDGGLTWKASRGGLTSPRSEKKPPHEGFRWFNNAVETSVVELADGSLYALCRTSMDQYYESVSKDFGNTWSPAKPSRFFGTLTMPTIGKLADGTLVALWTNTMALPENKLATDGKWEDVFTNRDSHHIALSRDQGKTWYGFRELILDEHRNNSDYATHHGAEDRGKHQSQFVQLDKNRILATVGQHQSHRKLMVIDLRWVGEKSRKTHAGENVEDWTIHTYMPEKKGHASYNRKPSCAVIEDSGKKVLEIKRLDDPSLVNEAAGVDYQNGGATWNLPNGTVGKVEFTFKVAPGEQADASGIQVSLTDRLFNACDATTKDYAIFTFPIQLKPVPCIVVGNKKVKISTTSWNKVGVLWMNEKATVFLNGKPVGKLDSSNPTPNGVSYVHFISTGTKPDSGVLLDEVEAKVK